MNSPTIRSAPESSAGRPATVTPNTTSSRPVSRPSSTPNAVCTIVFSVSACSRPSRTSDRVSGASSARSTRSGTTVACVCDDRGASRVPSSRPDSASRQACSDAAWSCAAMNDR